MPGGARSFRPLTVPAGGPRNYLSRSQEMEPTSLP